MTGAVLDDAMVDDTDALRKVSGVVTDATTEDNVHIE